MAEFDHGAAHRFFSADCFNRAWDLLDKAQRTSQEDQEMIRLNQASMWHWTQRPDCTDKNMSIGYWQASRIFAALGQGDNAQRYGELCLTVSQAEGVEPFYLAYAHEALARAAMVQGDQAAMQVHLDQARSVSEQIAEGDERGMLLSDLDTIG